ncbi:MAG: hypothetical protein ILP10_08830 [Lachnospiraceae bacterium]|nr:hypothetical protein [Lachnospiraceae bacterium]
MLDRIKALGKRLLEIWKKYTKRQKTIIISTVATVFLTLIILIILLGRVTYEKLYEFEDTATAKAAIEVLEEEGIEYQLDDDDRTILVNVKKKQEAVLALSDSSVMSEEEFTVSQLLDNDLSTTSNDKMVKNHLYMQSSLKRAIETITGVKTARVVYLPVDTTNKILADQKEIGCSVILEVTEEFDSKKSPVTIATTVAYAIGNNTTDKIKVIDQFGNLLFGGEEPDKDEQQLDANLAYKKLVEKWYSDKLFQLAVLNDYSYAEIVPALNVNCDKESVLYTEYLAGEGLEQGLYDTYKKISSESQGGSGDIPGTDSNDETDYYIQTSATGNSSYDELVIKYKPSERVTETLKEWGVIDNATSSMGITLTKVTEYTERDLEIMGLLEETTFEEYVALNSGKTKMDVDEELYQLFSDATGIPASRITITAYSQPNYLMDEGLALNWSLYLEILLGLLILALLAYVIFRGSKPQTIVEAEPELSVERLLATTKENQSLEDIEFGEKSETRKLIEKYIDENAEAVAALLRNWLNDDGWE